MLDIKFFKVSSLPPVLLPSAWYIVDRGIYADIYITGLDRIPKLCTNLDLINILIDTKIAQIVFPTPPTPVIPLSAYTHIQASASALWTVTHNLGYKPGGVYVEDTTLRQVLGDITQINNNQLTITYASAFAGTAYLS